MSVAATVGVMAGLWIVAGLTGAVAMRARGHAFGSWVVLGIVLGPFMVIPAGRAVMVERTGRVEAAIPADAFGGGIDVLVGLDGSPGSAAALEAALDLFGPRIDRLTLAHVVSFDGWVSESFGTSDEGTRAATRLVRAVLGRSPGRVVLSGRPAEALRRHGASGGYDVLVVGRRGGGASRAALGSVARALATRSPVPVLVGGELEHGVESDLRVVSMGG